MNTGTMLRAAISQCYDLESSTVERSNRTLDELAEVPESNFSHYSPSPAHLAVLGQRKTISLMTTVSQLQDLHMVLCRYQPQELIMVI